MENFNIMSKSITLNPTIVIPAEKSKAESYGLKNQVLSHFEVLGQSIANIAPTGTPTVVIPLVFAAAGALTWFAYAFALVGIVLIASSINQFAKRSASPGSIYTYIATGLGPAWGIAAGWTLLIAYIGCAASVTTGFANYVNVFLKDIFNLTNGLPPILLVVAILASVAGSWYIAYRDIKLSTRVMLGLELVSVAFILIVVIATLFHQGFSIDLSQFAFKDLTLTNLRLGLVMAIFSFTGFESAATLGSEAKSPLKSIPRALLQSAILVGLLFIVASYAQVVGFKGNEITLDKSDAPLQVLASKAGIGFFGILISVGAIFSFFACVLACINAGARVLFLMGRHGIFHSFVGGAHESNETPHNAVSLVSVIAFIPAAFLAWKGNGMFDIYGWLGTIATLGFILTYIVVSVAAPVYLYRRNELKTRHILVSLAGITFMVVALIGAVYPWPGGPAGFSIIAFGVLLLLGIIWGVVLYFALPKVHSAINKDMDEIKTRYEDGAGI